MTLENLIVHCPVRLAEVRKFADETGQREAFEQALARLCGPCFGQTVYVHLYDDFAPHSFYFVVTADPDGTDRIYNGGLIYHGSHDRGGDGGAPTFSVCLTPVNGWAIHT